MIFVISAQADGKHSAPSLSDSGRQTVIRSFYVSHITAESIFAKKLFCLTKCKSGSVPGTW